ncbi:MAG TPA: helix-turn-helix domain-containing protein, partial [Tahibacter sp.]|nr:helix-turn-helix domain-containing protein [Tahibacter sp.]
GRLREDLLYRLNVFPIEMPPLREHIEDVPLLSEHFLEQAIQQEGERKRFSPAVIDAFTRYNWPGNIRELRNAVYRSYVMASGEIITEPWLTAHGDAATEGGRGGESTLTVAVGTPLADVERTLILATLDKFGGHKEKTAAALGISLKTLYNRMKAYTGSTAGAHSDAD